MDLKTAKEKYKGLYIKDKGFYQIEQLQQVFKSEVNKGGKLAYLINDKIYLLPDIIKTTLRSYLEDNNTKLPSGVLYKEERFQIPFSYLQLFASDATPPKQETFVEEKLQIPTNTTDAELSIGTYTSSSYIIPILNKVAETAAKYRIMDSVDFYTSAMMHKRDIEDQMKYLLDEFIVKGTDESFTNLVLAGILYQKAQ